MNKLALGLILLLAMSMVAAQVDTAAVTSNISNSSLNDSSASSSAVINSSADNSTNATGNATSSANSTIENNSDINANINTVVSTSVNITNDTSDQSAGNATNQTAQNITVGSNSSVNNMIIPVGNFNIMMHLCPASITSNSQLENLKIMDKIAACPVVTRPGDNALNSTLQYDFNVAVEDGSRDMRITDATFVPDQLCADGRCVDTSYYAFNVTGNNIRVTETDAPTNSSLGAFYVDRNQTNGTAMVHLFNFMNLAKNITEDTSMRVLVSENVTQVSDASVNLYVKEWYPKGPDYVFVCDAKGFTPTMYSWYYGDGQKLINITNSDTYHVYGALGEYNVKCIATDGVNTAQGDLKVNVTSLQRPILGQLTGTFADLMIKEWYPKGPDYVFVCDVTGFQPSRYSWHYGDNEKLINITNRDTYHVYKVNGAFEVQCSASNENTTATASTTVNVNSANASGNMTVNQSGQVANSSVQNATVNQTDDATANESDATANQTAENSTNSSFNQTSG